MGEINSTSHYESKVTKTIVVSCGVVELWGSEVRDSFCLLRGRMTLKIFEHDSEDLELSNEL